MSKIYQVDMNIPTDNIAYQLLQKKPSAKEVAKHNDLVKEWQAANPETRGDKPELKSYIMDGCEFMRHMVLSAINQVHKSGNTKTLRRTKNIADQFSIAIAKGTTIELMADDYNFVKECMTKADQWTNEETVAAAVLLVEEAILDADILDAKPQEV